MAPPPVRYAVVLMLLVAIEVQLKIFAIQSNNGACIFTIHSVDERRMKLQSLSSAPLTLASRFDRALLHSVL